MTDKIKKGMKLAYQGDSWGLKPGTIVKVLGEILDDDGEPTGSYDVTPWIEKEQRFSFCSCSAEASELKPIKEEKR